MAAVPELLLETLVDLVAEDLRTFQWYLSSKVLEGLPHIPKSRLEGVDRPGTVDLLAQTYGYDGAVTVTVDILKKKMKFKLLAEELQKKYNQGKISFCERKVCEKK